MNCVDWHYDQCVVLVDAVQPAPHGFGSGVVATGRLAGRGVLVLLSWADGHALSAALAAGPVLVDVPRWTVLHAPAVAYTNVTTDDYVVAEP